MHKAIIVGGGTGGSAILKILKETSSLEIVAIIDINDQAPGILMAKQEGIQYGKHWDDFINETIDIIIEVTGREDVYDQLVAASPSHTAVIPGAVAYLIATLMDEKQDLIHRLKYEKYSRELILHSTGDGMIVINQEGKIILFNRSAEKMMGMKQEEAIGRPVQEIFPNGELLRVLRTKQIESNQQQVLANGVKVIVTRIPMVNDKGEIIGAFSVFKDITEVTTLAQEITNLKDIQTMLEAIIQSSDEAISVVDEEGKGLIINRAYTRITGLSKDEVIGKPATADISEGESMHMQVLKTRKPVRGVKLRVGPAKREVIVNVAPIIVEGVIKGSVGVIHDVSEIQRLTNELNHARQIIRTLEAKYAFDDIIGHSNELKEAIEQAQLGAKTPATILLRGESGTGKELFAHAIHNASDRKFNKFIRVNCAALSESLLESELFGYEEGAFSGAKRGGKRGLFEEANNGSIFLDEIGELSANTQAKLLRVLQEHEIIRVGGTKPIPINVRVIAATNVNLEKGIHDGTFREDLYYRLNRMPIQIPPLRNRKDDIPLLASRLIKKINQDYGRKVEGLTNASLKRLMEYDWPGNVRELENILGRAIIFMKYNEIWIDLPHLPELKVKINETKNETPVTMNTDQGSLVEILEQHEKEIIERKLKENAGNKTLTAKHLGISIRNLYYKIEKHQIAIDGMQ